MMKKFFCFSVFSGAIFAIIVLITFLISGTFWLDVETFSVLLVLTGWLLLTNRSWDSFFATALAVVFVKGITISAMDLCTIFSNLLDNAIEAVKAVKETNREISVSARKTGSFWLLEVKNNTAFKVEISDRIKTTKSDKKEHGFGIGNIDRAVQKCGGEFQLDCKKAGEKFVFSAEVMLPLRN